MKVIGVVSGQSGVGKSRTTWDVTVSLLDSAIDAWAVDCDPERPLAALNRAREINGNPPLPVAYAATPAALQALLTDPERSDQVLLLDIPARCVEPERSAMLAPADLVIIPTLATPAHIAATASIVRPLAKARRNFRFLLVRTATGGLNYDKALLANLGMSAIEASRLLLPMAIADRAGLMKDLNELGLGVLEAFGNARIDQESVGKASQEIRSVRQFLRDELDI